MVQIDFQYLDIFHTEVDQLPENGKFNVPIYTSIYRYRGGVGGSVVVRSLAATTSVTQDLSKAIMLRDTTSTELKVF